MGMGLTQRQTRATAIWNKKFQISDFLDLQKILPNSNEIISNCCLNNTTITNVHIIFKNNNSCYSRFFPKGVGTIPIHSAACGCSDDA